MSNIKNLKCTGWYCAPGVEFEYNETTHSVNSSSRFKTTRPLSSENWGVIDVRWAFVPPNLTDNEKEQFVEELNTAREALIDKCKKCCYCLKNVDQETRNKYFIKYFGTTDEGEIYKLYPDLGYFKESEPYPLIDPHGDYDTPYGERMPQEEVDSLLSEVAAS